jgi:hypothetical protein
MPADLSRRCEMAIYRKHGWIEPATAPVQPGPLNLEW